MHDRKIWLISIFFLYFTLVSCRIEQPVKIFIPLNNQYVYFYDYLEQFIDEESILLVKKDKNGEKFLLDIIKNIYLIIEVSEENIFHKDTLDYRNTGLPYKKKQVVLDKSGCFSIEETDNFRIEYNPVHPYAKQDGYVFYTAVVEEEEREIIDHFRNLSFLFSRAVKLIDNNYIFPEI